MVNLYLFQSTPVNITNLPHFCFLIAKSHQAAVGNCKPKISYGCFLDVDQSEFTKKVSAHDSSNTFRKVEWNKKPDLLNWLDQQLEQVQAQNRVQCISHYDVEQLRFLKNRYSNIAKIVSISYNTSDIYNALINYHVKSHLIKQELGLLPITDIDSKIRTSKVDLIAYYTGAFKEQNIISDYILPTGDYDIPVSSFFDCNNFSRHLCNLGVKITDETIEYYNSWYLCYKKFFKETL